MPSDEFYLESARYSLEPIVYDLATVLKKSGIANEAQSKAFVEESAKLLAARMKADAEKPLGERIKEAISG